MREDLRSDDASGHGMYLNNMRGTLRCDITMSVVGRRISTWRLKAGVFQFGIEWAIIA